MVLRSGEAALLLVEPSGNILSAAQQLDCPLHVVGAAAQPPRQLRPEDIYHQADIRSDEGLEVLLTTLESYRSALRGVVSTTEDGLLPAAVLAERLGVPGTPYAVTLAMRDKLRMREVLAAVCPEITVPAVPAEDRDAVADLVHRYGDVVVKPARGTASLGVRKVGSVTEFDGLTDDLRAGALVEPLVRGVEVTAETRSVGGQHTVFGVVEKHVVGNFVEVGHVLPPASLSANEVVVVEQAVATALDALSYADGVSCTEVIVSGDRAVIVETHNRLGGDGLADLVQFTQGVDWRYAAVAWLVTDELRRTPPRSPAAAVVFFTAPPGRVTEVMSAPPTLAGVSFEEWDVTVEPGDIVRELNSSADRLGGALFTAESAAACTAALHQIRALPVVITGSRGAVPPTAPPLAVRHNPS